MNHRRFLQYFLKNEGLLKAYLVAAVQDLDDADDLLQEVSSVLWEKFDRYDPARPFAAWALGVARLEVLNYRKGLARRREVLSEDSLRALEDTALQNAPEVDGIRTHLSTCLSGIKEAPRRVLDMRYREALPIQKIAERMGRKVGAVEMTLVRVRRALRECIDRRMHRIKTGN